MKLEDLQTYGMRLGTGEIYFVEMAPGQVILPLAPRYMFGTVPGTVTNMMFGGHVAGAVGYYVVRNARITYDGIALHRDTMLSCTATNHPDYHCALILQHADLDRLAEPSRTIEGRAVLLTGPGWLSWGHWLVDFLPRLYLLSRIGWNVFDLRWIIPARTPNQGRELLRLIGLPDAALVEYEQDTEVLGVPELIMPTNLTAGALMHPLYAESLAWTKNLIRRHADIPWHDTRKIFISRRSTPQIRELTNRAEIERLAARAGYVVIEPAILTALDQIGLFQGATHLAGEYGSGLHTSVFAPRGAVITCLRGTENAPGVLQNGLAQIAGQHVGYVFGEMVPGHPHHAFTVSERAFELALACAELVVPSGRLAT